MATVTISDVGKNYGSVKVLKGISVDIEDGQFVALVGPSGCGKSTLLRMIAGLEDISSGKVLIGDRVVNDLPPKARDIAMVFQNYALYPHMTVRDNLSFSMKLRKMSAAEMDRKATEAARILGIEPLLDRRPSQLSGGQRQRVAMGRAIVRDPKAFLFDEPLSNLDAKLRVQMRAEIKKLHQKLGTTTLYVTHDQVEAMTMADIIVVMRDGIIEQAGTPLELFDRPVNSFVASFIGSPSMNLFNGTMTSEGFTTEDGIILPTVERPINAKTYGIRPDSLVLDPNGVEIEVSVTEPTGSETQVIGQLGDHPIVFNVRERIAAKAGSKLRVMPDLSSIHLFDENGMRIQSTKN